MNRRLPRNAFRLYRPQRNMEMDSEHRIEFAQSYPDHLVYWFGYAALELVTKRETNQYLAYNARRVSNREIVGKMWGQRTWSSRQVIEVPPAEIRFGEPRADGTRPIAIVLSDEAGILEEERENFLRSLSRATGVDITPRVFVPRIEIGSGPSAPSIEAPEYLKDFIPDEISLSKVRASPALKNFT